MKTNKIVILFLMFPASHSHLPKQAEGFVKVGEQEFMTGSRIYRYTGASYRSFFHHTIKPLG